MGCDSTLFKEIWKKLDVSFCPKLYKMFRKRLFYENALRKKEIIPNDKIFLH